MATPINVVHMTSRDDRDSKEGMAVKAITEAMIDEMHRYFPEGTHFILTIITPSDADVTTSVRGKERITRMLQYILKITRQAKAI